METQSMIAVSSRQGQNTLTKKQSLALVKIFLNVSLALICHTRELLDWQSACFRKRYVAQISLDTDDVYHAFCNLDSAPECNSQEVRVLVRGSNRKADAILDMMECGVFGAIESAYLDVLQVFVTTDWGNNKAIQETYTYRFTYLDNAVASVELNEQQQFVSLLDAQRSFRGAIRSLLRSVKDFPGLPENCSLGMSMAYYDDCPAKYESTGFIDSANHQVLPDDWSRLWNQNGNPVSTFDAAHHNVSIAARNSTFGYQTASQLQDTVLSKQIQNLQKTSSARHPGLVSTLPLPISPQHSNPVPRQPSTSSQECPSRLTRNTSHKSGNSQQHGFEHAAPTLANDLEPGDPVANPLRGLTIQSKSRRRRNIIPEKMARAIVQAYSLDFEAEDGQTVFDSVQLERGMIYRIDQSNTVHCECGDEQHSDSMLYCHLCNSWQHFRCYGMSLLASRSLPDQHMCYSCLMLPEEEQKLRTRVEKVHMRLALMYISQLDRDMFEANQDFICAVFGAKGNASLSRNLIKRLIAERVVSDRAGGCLQILKASDETVRRLQTEYLDPLAEVEHLYQVVQSKISSQTDLQEKLRKYTGGCDYKYGQGVEERVVQNAFGEQVVCWGYFDDKPSTKRKAGMNTQDEPSPRRRKISISRAFIALDRSTPLEEVGIRREAAGWDQDEDSLDSSTATDV